MRIATPEFLAVGLQILARLHGREQPALEVGGPRDLLLARAGGPCDGRGLLVHDLGAGHTRAGQQHGEPDRVRAGGRQGRYGGALAVPDEADATRIDVRTLQQPRDPGQRVVREVRRRGPGDAASGAADAAVVVPEDRDPPPREMVGNDPEDGETEQFLVPVLRPRPRDHDHRREGPRPLGEGQGAFEVHVAGLEGDLLLAVRYGLVALRLDHCGALDGKRPRGGPLRELAFDAEPWTTAILCRLPSSMGCFPYSLVNLLVFALLFIIYLLIRLGALRLGVAED